MKSQVTVLLICMLFPKALSLTCNQCLSAIPSTCQQTSCPDQCLTSSVSVYMGGAPLSEVNVKSCGTPSDCVSGSMNLGITKTTINTKCCKTDLCNTETLPALPKQTPNGRMCYTCDANGCSGTLRCEGGEDRCISASVQQGSNTISVKGCTSKSICAASGTSASGMGMSNLQCCEGNLCNGAESFTLSFLLMIVPLLSSILFY